MKRDRSSTQLKEDPNDIIAALKNIGLHSCFIYVCLGY